MWRKHNLRCFKKKKANKLYGWCVNFTRIAYDKSSRIFLHAFQVSMIVSKMQEKYLLHINYNLFFNNQIVQRIIFVNSALWLFILLQAKIIRIIILNFSFLLVKAGECNCEKIDWYAKNMLFYNLKLLHPPRCYHGFSLVPFVEE